MNSDVSRRGVLQARWRLERSATADGRIQKALVLPQPELQRNKIKPWVDP